eukprot:TRINITY_DN79999_c0_g1_i1.p1 TRINITY_DN79999_c0_g1~~TRINITY_DN79999_c0_g1_i1.p1  ORF type:complete len:954 (+),score=225.53 TRINITY_DN79999_c0_g1_i1:36-2897(+)
MELDKARSTSTIRSTRASAVLSKEFLEQTLQDEKKRSTIKSKGPKVPRWTRISQVVVEHRIFVALTTVLTIYALCSDDVRLLATSQPADIFFNVGTCFCFVVFFFEILFSCLGKRDYFGGFFFYLDLMATVTLIFDVTFINEWILMNDEDNVDQMKNTRTARIGARATRVVRVLRLVRILKLYKAVLEQQAKAKAKQELDPDDWADEEGPNMDTENIAQESNLGKKLSDLSTRRCVTLILTMMFVHPLLEPPSLKYPQSSTIGADIVWDHFQTMKQNSSTRWRYESSLVHYAYFHNWFQGMTTEECSTVRSILCPGFSNQHSLLFWIGVATTQVDEASKAALQPIAKEAQISLATVNAYEKSIDDELQAADAKLIYATGTMPDSAKRLLASPWDEECPSNKGSARFGFSLLLDTSFPAIDKQIRCPEDLRRAERSKKVARLVPESDYTKAHMAFYFDNRPFIQAEAQNNMLTTLFICIVLCGASMMFSHDTQELVLKPVESMMVKVNMIRRNPLIAAKLSDEAFKLEEIKKAKAKREQQKRGVWRNRMRTCVRMFMCSPSDEKANKTPNETVILEKTIVKLGTLLALGFGEAGMTIISQNMQGVDSAGVDAMVPGVQVDCILGVARMGEFGTFTEVLQTRVMTFVNQVAEVIHGCCDAYHGAPSRNYADMFMLVWTLQDDDEKMTVQLADMAMLSFVMSLISINKSATLAAYRTHPGLQQRLGRRLRVTMTFSLHYGWAIEGALGSQYKIDATYVSPNVSIAENVERAAEVYGTSLLCTEAFHSRLSTSMASRCRCVDRVVVRGSPEAMNLFSLDLYYMSLTIEEPVTGIKFTTRQRYRARQHLETEKIFRLTDSFSAVQQLETQPDIVMMLTPYTTAFHEVFGMGYQNYVQGEWSTARCLLSRTCTQLGFEDGPSAALLRFMQQYDFTAPQRWRGVHLLEEMPLRHSARARS